MSEKKYYLLTDSKSHEAFGPFSKEEIAELDIPKTMLVCIPSQNTGLKPANTFHELVNLVVSVEMYNLSEIDTAKVFYIKHGKQYSELSFDELRNTVFKDTTPIGIGSNKKWYYAGNIVGLNEMLNTHHEVYMPGKSEELVPSADEAIGGFDLSLPWRDEYKNSSDQISSLLKAYLDEPKDPTSFVRVDFSKVYLEYKLKSHVRAFESINLLFQQVCPLSLQILKKYETDMAALDGLRIAFALRSPQQDFNDLNEVVQRIKDTKLLLDSIKSELSPLIHECLKKYLDENVPYFLERWELAPANASEWNSYKASSSMPINTIYLGKEIVSFTFFEEALEIPRLLYSDILNTTNLVLYYKDETEDLCFSFINSVLGRYMAGAQPGKVVVKVFDPKGFVGTSDAFRRNLGYNITDLYSIDINGRGFLDGILQEIAERKRTLSRKETVAQYNANPANRLFKMAQLFYLIIGETDLRDHELSLLEDILKEAPTCGICLAFLTKDKEFRIPENLPASYFCFDEERLEQDMSSHVEYSMLSEEQLKDICQIIKTDYVNNKNIVKFSDFQLPKERWWKTDCSNSAYIPFGIDSENRPVDLAFTQENAQNTAVVIGTAGSGKSVFIHDIILSAAMKYSPKDLQMYLIDFSGAEFKVYVPDAFHKDEDNQFHLPHALVVAPEVEREFGLSILKKIDEIAHERQIKGVNNLSDYNKSHLESPIPRILVIIDEYQKFFEAKGAQFEDAISREARQCITRIIKEYRKFGINIILATQELIGNDTLPYNLIGNHIVFKSKPQDFSNLIGTSMPKLDAGMCVYNKDSGNSSEGNRLVHSFFVPEGERPPIVKNIFSYALTSADSNLNYPTVFKARELPDINKDRYNQDHSKKITNPSIIFPYIGESIEISKHYLYFPLSKDANNNILITGGDPIHHVPEAVARYLIASTMQPFKSGEAQYYILNFLDPKHPTTLTLHNNFDGPHDFSIKIIESDFELTISEIKSIKDGRKKDTFPWIFLFVLGYDRNQVFFKEDLRENKPLLDLIDILEGGPVKGITTIVQSISITSLVDHLGANKMRDCFNHKIVFQMSESDSRTTMGTIDANLLSKIDKRVFAYRGFYHNNQSGKIIKFRPFDDIDIDKTDLYENND